MSQFIEMFDFHELNLNDPSNDFEDLCYDDTSSATKIPACKYLPSGKYAIYDQSQDNAIAGYTSVEHGLCKNYPAVLFGDHSRVIKYINEPFFIGADGVKILRPKTDAILPEFLYYDLKYHNIPNTGYNRHFKYIKMIKLCKATMDEQNRFLSFAHQADKSEFGDSKSQFIEMFDFENNSHNWPMMSFCEFASLDCTMTTDYDYYADYPHIGIDSIEQNTGRLLGYRTVKEDNVKSGKYIFTSKHVIYSKIRPNLNKVATPDFDGLCSADSYPILANEEITSKDFLAYLMRSEVFLRYIVPLSNRTGMPKVNREQVEAFSCPIPPKKVQNKFVSIYHQADKSEYELRSKIDAIDNDIKSFINENMKRIEYRYTLGKNTFIIMDGSICKVNPIFV